MGNLLKKYSKVGIASLMGLSLLGTANYAFASDDNIGYSFTIKPHYGNAYTGSRYRQTTSDDNPWKVNLVSSSEGAGTITTFWIEGIYGIDGVFVLASPTMDVKQGSGARYSGANSAARQTDVRLGAENNNDSPSSYSVSGYWDEETW